MDLYLRTPKDYNDPTQAQLTTPFYFGDGTNDLQVDTDGDFSLIQGPANLDQGLAKILSTEQGANQFFSLYGSVLWGLIGSTSDMQTLQAQVQGTIVDALRIYQFINQSNPNLDEQIDILESLSVTSVAVAFIQLQIPALSLLTGTVARDVVIESPAQEFANVYTELQRLEDIQTLSDPTNFTTAEMVAAAADVGLSPLPATSSTGLVTFRTNNLTSNVTIGVNTTVSTSPTTLNPATVSFQVTAGGTMFASNASSYLNPLTGLYELQLPVQSVSAGVATNVAAKTITVLSTAVTGISSISNALPTSGGADAETNTALAARIVLKLSGNNVGTAAGIQSLVLTNVSVVDSLIIRPGDPLLLRDQFGNSVNVVVQGEILTQVIDTKTYNTGTLTYVMNQQPVSAVVLVTGVVGGVQHDFLPVTDYSVFIDYLGVYEGTVKAISSITFLNTGTLPDSGTQITISYSINSLIPTLQALLNADTNKILGS